MAHGGRRGFTLIELLLVMLIIAILLAFLMPAVGTVRRAMKVRETERRVEQLNTYVELYKTVYGDYPPSAAPKIGAAGYPWKYPVFYKGGDINNQGQYSLDCLSGGIYLTYFLLGPEGGGWSRSVYANISAEWKAPDALAGMLCDRLITVKEADNRRGIFFQDAFGYDGIWFNGLIEYSRADPREKDPSKRFARSDLYASFYWSSTRGFCGGDDPPGHIARLTGQTSMPFVIVAPGPDHLFGYYVWDPSIDGGIWKADATRGMTDDICNFQHD